MKVHLVSGRNIKYGSELCDSVFCKFNFINQPKGCINRLSKYKSDIHVYDGDHEDNVILWDDIFDLGPCYSVETMIHFRVFEYKVARKDMLIAECKISIGDIIKSIQQSKSAASASAANAMSSKSDTNTSPYKTANQKKEEGSVLNEEVLQWYPLVPVTPGNEDTRATTTTAEEDGLQGSGELKIGVTFL